MFVACDACRQATRPLGHVHIRRMDAVVDDHPSSIFPELDIFPANMPMPVGGPHTISSQLSPRTDALVRNSGSIVSVRGACAGDAKYHVTVQSLWTDRTHPGAPQGRFWYPLAAQAHEARCEKRMGICLPYMSNCLPGNQAARCVQLPSGLRPLNADACDLQ
jgi:hypothetical protein